MTINVDKVVALLKQT